MKKKLFALSVTLLLVLSTLFSACSKEPDLTEYISENRLAYFLCDENKNLKAYYSFKEYPYSADGIPSPSSPVVEIFLYVDNDLKSLSVSFNAENKECGGEFSYDSVKKCFYYYESARLNSFDELTLTVTTDGVNSDFTLKNKKSSACLSEEKLLNCVKEAKSDLFSSLIKDGEFYGEIYLRYIYDDGDYYYVGIIDKENNITALLLDAKSGEIIAERDKKFN